MTSRFRCPWDDQIGPRSLRQSRARLKPAETGVFAAPAGFYTVAGLFLTGRAPLLALPAVRALFPRAPARWPARQPPARGGGPNTNHSVSAPMDFKAISSIVDDDFEAVNRFITHHLDTGVPLIREVGDYIVDSGGKRMRPLVSLLSARAAGYQGGQHVDVAAVIEFLHTATLLHDDVVDESSLRRGRPTVNAVWGNSASVLVGDFLISRALQLLVALRNHRLLEILSQSTNTISEGEVLQLINRRDPTTTEASYMRVIHHKTAKMFESAAETGAVLGIRGEHDQSELFARFGRHLGIAFQLIDDVLDYQGNVAELGKNVGDDLAEGKPTLPLIYAMQHGNAAQAELIRGAIRSGGLDNLTQIVDTVRECGGLQYTIDRAAEHTRLALEALEPVANSKYKEALYTLAEESLKRTH